MILTKPLNNQLMLKKIEKFSVIDLAGGISGYHRFGTRWWTSLDCPYSYTYPLVDSLYPYDYFAEKPEGSMGHPNESRAQRLFEYMQSVFETLFGRKFASVLELGSGGGFITKQFLENDLDFVAVEGAGSGIEQLKQLGVPLDRVVHANLKFMNSLSRKFDLVMCTEVAEHIEPWFASKIVENCVAHSDVVWWSSASGSARPHYHHMNEAPIEAWDNLFAQFDMPFSVHLDGTEGRADRVYISSELGQKMALSRVE